MAGNDIWCSSVVIHPYVVWEQVRPPLVRKLPLIQVKDGTCVVPGIGIGGGTGPGVRGSFGMFCVLWYGVWNDEERIVSSNRTESLVAYHNVLLQ